MKNSNLDAPPIKQIIGYTTGVYDLFHIGHLNLLRNAKAMCDKLVVGVSTDEVVAYKHKSPVIPYVERIEIVRACQYVDLAIPQHSLDKFEAWEKINFDVLFVGDDWFQQPRWEDLQEKLTQKGVRVMYFPYTSGTSSTIINETLKSLRDKS